MVVPLALSHPDHELEYVLSDARVKVVLATEEYADRLQPLAEAAGAQLVVVRWDAEAATAASAAAGSEGSEGVLGDWRRTVEAAAARLGEDRGALVIYTSGTTGRPKGAVHTHGSVAAQVAALSEAWRWSDKDRILHCLPMHHVHGIVNACYCALGAGATIDFLPKFSPSAIWSRLIAGHEGTAPEVTLFMGVPTMYVRLLQAYDGYDADKQGRCAAAARSLRMAVSGSAACPVPLFERWEAVTGARLLERYGMTEIGMALSNPYEGERRSGAVGMALPGMEVILVDPATGKDCAPGQEGEIRVKGRNLFREYLGRPEATRESFDERGFFKTGDAAVVENGYFRILGRESVDIIKSGGYKLSALEIEGELLNHPDIVEIAICGVEDEVYGQVVGAVVALKEGAAPMDAEALRQWAKPFLAPYKLPRLLRLVDKIPRNAMSKVNKKTLVKIFDASADA